MIPSLPGRRRLARALLLPRPREFVIKVTFVVVGCVLGRATSRSAGLPAGALAGAVVAFELVAYQARYLVNDLLDARHDAEHPNGRARGRLAAGVTPWVRRVAFASIGLRCVTTGLIAASLPGRAGATTTAAVGALVAITIAYESVRQGLRRSVPPGPDPRSDRRATTLFVLVGSGYALRAGLGLALAGLPWWAPLSAAAYAWPFGVAFVTMSWTLEATAFIEPGWGALDARVGRKRHLAVLVHRARLLHGGFDARAGPPMQAWVLAPAPTWQSPWVPAIVLASLGAGLLAVNLSTGWQPRDFALWAWFLVVCINVLAGVATCASQATWPWWRVLRPALGAAAGSVAVAVTQHATLAAVAAAPVILLAGPVALLRRMSYQDVVGMRTRVLPTRRARSATAPAGAGRSGRRPDRH